MNRKFLSVFFSALVCSTLGHEHLKAHELQRSHHARSLGSHNARSHHQQCSYVCPVPQPSPEVTKPGVSLSLVFIEETKVFALVNSTLEVAIVLQIGEPIALIANGKTGVSIVVNIDKQTLVHYPAGSNGNLWKESQSNLVDYLENLGPLTNVNNWKNGHSFKLSSVTKEVKNILISIVQYLDIEIAIRVQVNPDAVISLISVLINTLLETSDVVELLLTKLETSVTIILGGLSKLVNLIVGLKSIGKRVQGGLHSLITDDLNISLLLGENSGLNSLLNLLIQIGVHVDLTKILGDILQSPEKLLGLAVELDGGIYVGISGITAVIYNVQLYANRKISLDALIDILLQVEAANGHVKISTEVYESVLNWYFVLAQSQASQYNTGSSWSSMNKFFQDIKNEKLIINGINVSAIINILISTSGNTSLNNVVKILVQLKPVCALNKLIATLYFRLIYFVISGQGLVFIGQLLPEITIKIDLSSTTSILKQILSSVNVLQIVSYLLRLDIVGALTHLPVLGPILKALDEILKVVGLAAEVTVTSALKAVGSILDDLKNILLFGLGRGGKAPSNAGIAGLSLLGGGISVSIKTSWVSSEKWSSSNGGTSGSTISSTGSTSQSQVTTVATPSSSKGSSLSSSGSTSGSSSSSSGSTRGSSSSSSGSTRGSTSSVSSSESQGTTVSTSGSTGGSKGGSGSHSGGISIGGGSSSNGGTSSGGSGSGSGGISVGGGSSSSGGSSSGGSGSHSGGISVGGGSSSSGGSSSGGSGSHSGGISVGGGSSSSGGSSSGGSGSHSGGISLGGDASSGGQGSGGSSSGGSASHSGGISVGGGSISGSGGSSSGGKGSHSGGISIGGSASSSGGNSAGGSATHSGGVSVGGSGSSKGEGNKGSNGWGLGNLLGGGTTSSHRWSLF